MAAARNQMRFCGLSKTEKRGVEVAVIGSMVNPVPARFSGSGTVGMIAGLTGVIARP
jgi:hypothetical protein